MSESSKSVPTKKSVAKKVVKKTVKKQAAKKKVARKQAAKSPVARKKTVKKKAAPRSRVSEAELSQVSHKERYEMIAMKAYFRAEKRGFEPGWEQQDWYESEREIDEMLGRKK